MTSKGFEDFLLRGDVAELAMTAAVICTLVVLPMEALVERRAHGEEPGPARPTQVEPLAEIRDLLRAQQGAGAAQAPSRGSP